MYDLRARTEDIVPVLLEPDLQEAEAPEPDPAVERPTSCKPSPMPKGGRFDPADEGPFHKRTRDDFQTRLAASQQRSLAECEKEKIEDAHALYGRHEKGALQIVQSAKGPFK